jgi:DNA-binding response OmpR family regulator
MDEDAREVRRAGKLIELTATEFELLRFLMRNPRRVLSKAQILDRSGTTTSAARRTSSSRTSATCARRSTRAVSR